MIRTLGLCLLVAGAVAACGSPLVGKLATKAVGVKSTAAQATPAKGAPEIWLTLSNKKVKFAMAKLQSRDGVDIMAAADGTQVFLRDGMLIGSRGFGQDLMSAEAPSMATIRSQTGHRRVNFPMDGTDTPQREGFDCTAQAPPQQPHSTNQSLEERCESPLRVIRNQFTFDISGTVLKTRQWLTKGIGYSLIEPKVE